MKKRHSQDQDQTDSASASQPELSSKPAGLNWLVSAVISTIFLCVIFAVGFGLATAVIRAAPPTTTQSNAAPKLWTCSMHPQIQLQEKVPCPICGMELIPVGDESADANAHPDHISLSPQALALAHVQTTRVERKFVSTTLRFDGKVDYDETRTKTITAWASGRIERLYVDYTGIKVNEGDHLFDLYSPALISAQEELIQSIKAMSNKASDSESGKSEFLDQATVATAEAAREKLRLFGVKPTQIEAIEKSGKVSNQLTIFAPVNGVVVHKNARLGDYVKIGMPIYKIADLRKVWVKLEVYESDLTWLKYGQTVNFETEAYPGHQFSGQISFIDPILDSQERTIMVRVSVDNHEQLLKPYMFVTATVSVELAAKGTVLDKSLVGKWISPMHPEIVKSSPGTCDICGMALVPTESLGFVSPDKAQTKPPLVIPASAVLQTGKRAVVYVKQSKTESSSLFAARMIDLGPKAGDSFIVLAGLNENEEVVTNGAFKVDSAAQILAKPSMMNADKLEAEADARKLKTVPELTLSSDELEVFKTRLESLITDYLAVADSLCSSNVKATTDAAGNLHQKLHKVSANKSVTELYQKLDHAIEKLVRSESIDQARMHFEIISDLLIGALKQIADKYGAQIQTANEMSLRVVHCPMAFDNKGANWLQVSPTIANPYFGESMLRCGSVTKTFDKTQTTRTKAPIKTESRPASQPTSRPIKPETTKAKFDKNDHWQTGLKLYLQIQTALAQDDFKSVEKASTDLTKWNQLSLKNEVFSDLVKAISDFSQAKSIKTARDKFFNWSQLLIKQLEMFEPEVAIQKSFCPMAFDNGAAWLEPQGKLFNPYFGSAMLHCGDIQKHWSGLSTNSSANAAKKSRSKNAK